MLRTQVVIAFLLGAVVALGGALLVTSSRGLPEAYAQTAGNNDMIALAGTGDQGKSKETLMIIDSKSQRLAVYQFQNLSLQLCAIRNMQYDLKFEEWPGASRPQSPTVAEQRDATRKEDAPKKK
jgi:hypothetical protein